MVVHSKEKPLTSLQRDSWSSDIFHIHIINVPSWKELMWVTIFSKVVWLEDKEKRAVKMGFLDLHSKYLKANMAYSCYKVSLLFEDILVRRQFKCCYSCSICFPVLPPMPKARQGHNPLLSEGIGLHWTWFQSILSPKGKPPYKRGDEPSTRMINLTMGYLINHPQNVKEWTETLLFIVVFFSHIGKNTYK